MNAALCEEIETCGFVYTGTVLSRRVKINFLMVVLNALPRMKKKIKNRKMIKWKFCYSAPLLPEMEIPSPACDHSCQALGKGPAWLLSKSCQTVCEAAHHGPGVISRSKKCLSPEWPTAGMGLYKWLPAGKEHVHSIASCSTIYHSSLSKWQTGRPRCLG